MKWNTKHVAVAALLVLAGGALFVDRFVVGYGPRGAEAAVAAPAAPAAPSSAGASALQVAAAASPAKAAKAAGAAKGSGGGGVAPMSERLRAVAPLGPWPGGMEEMDAFAVPAALRPPAAAPAATAAAEQGKTPEIAEEPGKFTLTSVVYNARTKCVCAHINGRLVCVGETIDGHKLTRVLRCMDGSTLAILVGKRGEVHVRMTPEAGLAAPSADDAPRSKVSVKRS